MLKTERDPRAPRSPFYFERLIGCAPVWKPSASCSIREAVCSVLTS